MPYVVFNPALCSWVGGKLFLCCCTFIPVTVYGCNGKMFFGIPRQDRGVDITCLSDILCNDIFRPTGVYRIFIRCINNVHRIITWIIVGSGLPFNSVYPLSIVLTFSSDGAVGGTLSNQGIGGCKAGYA